MLHLSKWILKKQNEAFLQALIETKAQVDETTDKQIRRVLLEMRYKRAIAPYIAIFKLGWEIVRGRYRKSSSQSNGGADPTSSGGAGAAGQSVAQFTGYASGFSNPAGATSPGGIVNLGTANPPNSRYEFEDAGIKAGEIVAYRAWRLRNGLLYSVFQGDFCWEPGKIIEGNPADGNGIHAFKSILLLSRYGSSYASFDTIVTGTIDLWGDVYEHERGYRASKAVIRSIDDSSDYDAKMLRRLYGLNRKKPRKKSQ